jgi:hypothetical protein
MDIILRKKLQHMTLHQKNEGIKHGSYDRVLQRRRRQVFVVPILNTECAPFVSKKNQCLCLMPSLMPS